MRHAQLSALHVVEGRNAESLAELRSVVAGTDLRHLDRGLSLALAHARVGDLDEARPWLEAVVDGGFDQIAGDGSHVATLAMVGRICSVVGDAGRAPLIAARLAPFAGHHEVIGHGAYVGAVDNTRARLALVAGDLDEAAALFEGAAEQHRRVGSPTLEAFSQFGQADALRRRGRGNDLDEARRLTDHAMATTARHGAGISLVARAANE
jgi:hypothetical protein